MPPATAEKPKPLVSSPDKATVFFSRRTDLELVKVRDTPRYGPNHEQLEPLQGQRVQFRDGKLRVPPGGFVIGTRGERIKSQDVLDWLLGNDEKGIPPHHLLGDREEGIWQHTEPAPAPSEDELAALQTLAEDRDAPGLEAFIAQEQGGWDRPALLKVAEGSLARVKARLAETPK